MALNKKDVAVGLSSAAAVLSGAHVASAADASMAPVDDWSGLYAGVSLGTEWGDSPFNTSGGDYQLSNNPVFGGFVGLNQQYGDLVVGAELALQTGTNADKNNDGGDYKVNYTADTKIKVGMDVGHDILVYGFGGVSGGGVTTLTNDYAFFGVNYGVGAEFMVTQQMSIGAELMGRSIIDTYTESSSSLPGANYQATLRAAFHF